MDQLKFEGLEAFHTVILTMFKTYIRYKDSFAVRALHPRPEGRGFPHNTDKNT